MNLIALGRSAVAIGLIAVAMAWIAVAGGAAAATWRVAPDGAAATFGQALKRAADGDVIEVMPGHYRGEVAVITHKRLSIRGIGARPVFSADGRHAEGKAIWVIRDGDITIDNIEFRGARVPDGNGAGIRFEHGRLRLVRCAFYDNEMGLLTSNDGDAELHIEDSQFGLAPQHAGSLHHLLYVGRIARFSVSGSHFSQGHIGHLIKSRARRSDIRHNHIVDGSAGRASYEIDLPNGGLAQVSDNRIGQSALTENPALVSFGAEGAAWPHSALSLERNTLISELAGPAFFLRVWTERLPPGTRIEVRGNRLSGQASLEAGPGALLEDNLAIAPP